MEPIGQINPSEDPEHVAPGRRDSLPSPHSMITTTTGTERLQPPSGGANMTQEVRSPNDAAERRSMNQGGFQHQTQPQGNGVHTGSEFYEAYDMSICDEEGFGGVGTLGDLFSQLQPTDGVNVPATPGFGAGTMTPVMQGPMTPVEMTAEIEANVQVKNIMFHALKRIDKELGELKAKDVRRERRIKDLTEQMSGKLKAIQYNQVQMNGAIRSSQANATKTEEMLEDMLRKQDGPTSNIPSPRQFWANSRRCT